MSLAELLPIAGGLSAPAFFLVFALASLGSPLLALVCLLAAQVRNTQNPEAYARRLLRLALSCALPALPVFFGAIMLLAWRKPWLADWLYAAPLGPSLLAVALLAYCASLLTLRLSRPSSRHRQRDSALGHTAVLCLLAVVILWLAAVFCANLLHQAQAVLRAPMEGHIGVVQLITFDATLLPLNWGSLAAIIALCMASAGAISLEYLLLLRDREPFGRDAQAHMLRLAARATLRSTLLAGAFLPVLWAQLPEMPSIPGGHEDARLLLLVSGAACLLLCICAGLVARSNRPWKHALTIHASLLLLWLGLTALLSVGLLAFYAA